MNLVDVFQMVAVGRRFQGGQYFWLCPVCYARVGPSSDPTHRDRRAIDHCLSHATAFSCPPGSSLWGTTSSLWT